MSSQVSVKESFGGEWNRFGGDFPRELASYDGQF